MEGHMSRRFSMRGGTRAAGAFALLLTFAAGGRAPRAERAPTADDVKRLEGEIARLQGELREQRALLFQLMQMHEALLKYLQAGGGTAPGAAALGGPPPLPPAGEASATAPKPEGHRGSSREEGTVTGQVRIKGGALGEAYVYLEGSRSTPSHPPTFEIKQQGRQFVPAVAVVQVGTQVVFPNQDVVFHNVFSSTPGDAFDLGTLKGGQTSAPVSMLKPGHVEIFCNIHSKMRADVLVVPNAHWARVHPDGTFSLPSVPGGSRRLVVWGPTLRPVSQQIEVSGEGASVTFETELRPPKPHLNKQGAAYGSYEN
jgi:plastocyanin